MSSNMLKTINNKRRHKITLWRELSTVGVLTAVCLPQTIYRSTQDEYNHKSSRN
jgi:hypothetical protein